MQAADAPWSRSALITLAGAAGEAWARAGGGGSRGSRSYAPPSRPAPMSPASPASPSRSLNTPAPSPRPGMFGGLMGALGGFMLGGLLGSMLFGGIGGLGRARHRADGHRAHRRRPVPAVQVHEEPRQQHPQPAYAGRRGAARPAPAGRTVVAERPSALDDLDRGLGHIRAMDAASTRPRWPPTPPRRSAPCSRRSPRRHAPLRPRLTSEISSGCRCSAPGCGAATRTTSSASRSSAPR